MRPAKELSDSRLHFAAREPCTQRWEHRLYLNQPLPATRTRFLAWATQGAPEMEERLQDAGETRGKAGNTLSSV
ncbi:hypothetical protein MRX96_010392 [Rhipicephalus microplus]